MEGIRKISAGELPERLMEIPNPPKELWVVGDIPPKEHKWLTVVGSRAYTEYGKRVCENLIGGLSGHPVVIVSGLALGIDSIVHNTAIDAGILTVAVPGSGLNEDVLYPRSNLRLAKEIISKGGLLLSEFEPNTKANTYTFPKRNRIMSGLSSAVLLIEAEEKSGTLITARLASDYNRDLCVVPGSIFSENSKGVHQFLKLGATPITCSDDLLLTLGIESSNKESRVIELSAGAETEIYKLLSYSPLSRDEICQKTNLNITECSIILTKMELRGIIFEQYGKYNLA